jgi:hypothetical protein
MKITRKSIAILTALLTALFIVLIRQSISFGIMRLGIVLSGILVIVGLLYLLWRQRLLRSIGLSMVLSVLIFLGLPGNPGAGRNLQSDYLQMLRTYEGSPYVWGGENHLGIDCSGLVREGLIQANLQHGLRTFNPALVRSGLEMWWFDAGADALLAEYRGYTQRLFPASSVNQLDLTKIQPGDLAATADGEHILAYLGDRQWIEADPDFQKVVIETVPTDNHWFNVPIHTLRWNQFAP